jgi:hypothetical protein
MHSAVATTVCLSHIPFICFVFTRVNTNEDLSAREVHGADVGSMVAYKWWTQVDQVATKDGKLRK